MRWRSAWRRAPAPWRAPRPGAAAIPRGDGGSGSARAGARPGPSRRCASWTWAFLARPHPGPRVLGNAVIGMRAAELLERLVGLLVPALAAQARDALELLLRRLARRRHGRRLH